MNTTRTVSNKRGFTLFEFLIAMSIGGLFTLSGMYLLSVFVDNSTFTLITHDSTSYVEAPSSIAKSDAAIFHSEFEKLVMSSSHAYAFGCSQSSTSSRDHSLVHTFNPSSISFNNPLGNFRNLSLEGFKSNLSSIQYDSSDQPSDFSVVLVKGTDIIGTAHTKRYPSATTDEKGNQITLYKNILHRSNGSTFEYNFYVLSSNDFPSGRLGGHNTWLNRDNQWNLYEQNPTTLKWPDPFCVGSARDIPTEYIYSISVTR